jgi:hypothetical protein
MGLFDSAATKRLKKDAGFIGQLVAGQAQWESCRRVQPRK